MPLIYYYIFHETMTATSQHSGSHSFNIDTSRIHIYYKDHHYETKYIACVYKKSEGFLYSSDIEFLHMIMSMYHPHFNIGSLHSSWA